LKTSGLSDLLRRDLAAVAGPGWEGNRSCSYTDQAGEHDVRAGGLRVADLTLVGRRNTAPRRAVT